MCNVQQLKVADRKLAASWRYVEELTQEREAEVEKFHLQIAAKEEQLRMLSLASQRNGNLGQVGKKKKIIMQTKYKK